MTDQPRAAFSAGFSSGFSTLILFLGFPRPFPKLSTGPASLLGVEPIRQHRSLKFPRFIANALQQGRASALHSHLVSFRGDFLHTNGRAAVLLGSLCLAVVQGQKQPCMDGGSAATPKHGCLRAVGVVFHLALRSSESGFKIS